MKNYLHLSLLTEFYMDWEIIFKKFGKNQKAHYWFNNFFPENNSVYKNICQISSGPDRPQLITI